MKPRTCVVAALVVLLLVGCTSANKTAASSPVGSTGVASVSPSTPPPRPALKQARVEGTYRVAYIRLSSNVSGLPKREERTWVVQPRCAEGACNVLVKSYWTKKVPGPHWSSRALFLKGTYKFSRNDPKAFTCGSGGNVQYYIPAVYAYSFEITRMALVGGQWVATLIEGELDSQGTRGCGLSGPPNETEAIRGSLVRS